MHLPHAEGIPVVEFNSGNRASTLSTYSCPYQLWPKVLIGGEGCCVAQLLGLTQFDVILRHPQHPQSHRKCINCGVIDRIFCTAVYHINGLAFYRL